jgi:type I restriction enzyme S subunit
MGSEWITLSLQDLGRIITGKTPSTKDSENFGGDIPFVSPRDLDGDRYIDNTERTLTLKGAESVKNSIVPERSVLVSCIGSDMGKAAINRRECVTNQQINSIIVSNNFDAKFVYYNLSTRKDEIRGLAGGSAQPILNKGDFGRLEITLPESISEQRDISSFLGFLDDKIELNRQINTTLESMAQALFKSWFVDFDPVIDNALAAGNEIPDALQKRAAARAVRRDALRQQTNKTTNKTTGATDAVSVEQALPETGLSDQRLPCEIQQLFPDRFVLTEEMGWVPEGWEVTKVAELMDLSYGKSLPATKRVEGTVPVYGSGGVSGYHNEHLVNGPGIIVGRKGTVGSLYWVEDDFFPIDTVFFVENKTELPLYWLYQTLGTLNIAGMGADSAVPGVNRNTVYACSVVVPTENVTKSYGALIDSLNSKKESLRLQERDLADLRDSLLPKLLSGQITIPDAGQQLAGVL